MTQLEQLMVIIDREIKQKVWMQKQESTLPRSQYYYTGCIASLKYIKFIAEKMNQKDEHSE
jgi:hypothetical protein